MVRHRSLVNYVVGFALEYDFTPEDRVLQFTALSFDVSAEEIFSTLLAGATLALRTESMINSYSTFMRETSLIGVTVLDLPTAYWHGWMAATPRSDEYAVLPRFAIVGGEASSPGALASWYQAYGNAIRFANGYGPTEATIAATRCDFIEKDGNAPVLERMPIGKPVANVRIYILDQRLQPVPVGVPGEIYIGGDGLARGYLNHPEATAEKFVISPFGEKEEGRLYRTGDLGRYGEDGSIDFLGRLDYQVKVRGFRVELGEIETALTQHFAVDQAVVLALPDAGGGKRLVAYFVSTRTSAAKICDGTCRRGCPTYMRRPPMCDWSRCP